MTPTAVPTLSYWLDLVPWNLTANRSPLPRAGDIRVEVLPLQNSGVTQALSCGGTPAFTLTIPSLGIFPNVLLTPS